jgi:PhzF family phenazine biosynthesis protein
MQDNVPVHTWELPMPVTRAPVHVDCSTSSRSPGDPFSGNPLAVVEDAVRDLDAATMQAIARQFNLSETTFVTPGGDTAGEPDPDGATAEVRIFTPDRTRLPFAGPPDPGYGVTSSPRASGQATTSSLRDGGRGCPVVWAAPLPDGG